MFPSKYLPVHHSTTAYNSTVNGLWKHWQHHKMKHKQIRQIHDLKHIQNKFHYTLQMHRLKENSFQIKSSFWFHKRQKYFSWYQAPTNVTGCPNLSSCWNFLVQYWYGCRMCFCSDVTMNQPYDDTSDFPVVLATAPWKPITIENVLQCIWRIFLLKKTAVPLFNNSNKKKHLSDKTDIFLPEEDDCSHSLFPFTRWLHKSCHIQETFTSLQSHTE
jgi:hypothetical protein